MAGATKVKKYGFTDERWTTKDSIRQYHGLINLCLREKKILEADLKQSVEKRRKQFENLNKGITKKRTKLKNFVDGDKQQLRNILQCDREMQLALQNLDIKEVIDRVTQYNFRKRKTRDLLRNRNAIKGQELIKLKADHEIVLQLNPVYPRTRLEDEICITTGKVQNIELRKEAAITVKNAYKALVKILMKDKIYYDYILQMLHEDGVDQGKKLVTAIKAGQVATEVQDDCETSHMKLRVVFKTDMKMRRQHLQIIRTQIDGTVEHMHDLIKSDSKMSRDCGGCGTEIPACIERDVEVVTDILEYLKEVTQVSAFENIIPCLEEQISQTQSLKKLSTQFVERRKTLVRVKTHMELRYNELINFGTSNSLRFKQLKSSTEQDIEYLTEQKEEIQKKVFKNCTLITKIRSVMQTIFYLMSSLKYTNNNVEFKSDVYINNFDEENRLFQRDIVQLMHILETRLTHLMAKEIKVPITNEEENENAHLLYGVYMANTSKQLATTPRTDEIELDEVILNDATIPTRNSIKQESRARVAYYKSNQSQF